MNVASQVVLPVLVVVQRASRYSLWTLAGFGLFILIAFLARPTRPHTVVAALRSPTSINDIVLPPERIESKPFIPGVLLSEQVSVLSESSSEPFRFNFRANSFESLHYPRAARSIEKIALFFQNSSIGDASSVVLSRTILVESAVADIHPCFITALLLAPSSTDIQGAATAEMRSRAALLGLNLQASEESGKLLQPDVVAALAVRYSVLLHEIYPGQGNLIALAYWLSFPVLEQRLQDGVPFETADLDLLQDGIGLYQRCVAVVS